MTRLALDALVMLAVLSAWLGCAGFLRLRTALDRMHCVAFVNATAGILLTLAAFVSDGPSDRALKIALLTGLALLAGAASSHAIGRALLIRGDLPDALRIAGVAEPADPRPSDETRG